MDISKCIAILAERQTSSASAPTEAPHPEVTSSTGTDTHACSACNAELAKLRFLPHCQATTTTGSAAVAPEDASESFTAGSTGDHLRGMTNLELFNLCTSLQGERVQIYTDYNTLLEQFIEKNSMASYPILCAEVTSLFSVLSSKMIAIKAAFRDRQLDNAADLIGRLQDLEKDKLLQTAALHLEQLRTSLPEATASLGPQIPGQLDLYKQRIRKIEESITEVMEMIQEAKCDHLD